MTAAASPAPASSPTSPASPPPRPPLLERVGVHYFRRLAASMPRPRGAGDEINVLNDEERRELRDIARAAVVRACLAGAVSAIVAATAELLAQPLLGPDPDAATLGQSIRYWALVGGVTGLAAVIEILFLYWDSLRSVYRLACAAGLDLFPPDEEGTQSAVAAAMARAALELPNPTDRVFGVDPRRETSRFRLVVATLLYKLKVSVSNFALKVLVRRLLGRALVRAWLPFVAVPVTAAWNGVVTFVVLREARIRAMGPSAAQQLVKAIFEGREEPSPEAKVTLARAVASAIVRTEDLHPNLLAVLTQVMRAVGEPGDERLDDPAAFLQALPKLSALEQRMALQVLLVAAIIDGRFTAAERRLLRDAQRALGREPDERGAEAIRKAFVSGDREVEALVRAFG